MLLPLLQLPHPFSDAVQASSPDMELLQLLFDDGAESNNHVQIDRHNCRVYRQKPEFRHGVEQ